MIIEIPNENSIVKWRYKDNEDWKSAEISDLIKAYERPQSDLISREVLKKHIAEIFEIEEKIDKKWAMGLKYSLKLVDNAPTVVKDYDTGYQDGLEDGLNDIRPQGEWVESHIFSCGKILRMQLDVIEHKCKNCGRWSIKWVRTIPDNFCSYCGASIKEVKKND